MLYLTFEKFKNNCLEDGGNRLFESKILNNVDIKVELKTKLYPNPNNGEFTISVANLKENKKIEVLVFDLLGKLVYSEIKMATDNAILLKPNLMNGTYVVKIKLTDGTFDIHKLIIEK